MAIPGNFIIRKKTDTSNDDIQSFTAKIDLTQVRKVGDLLLREIQHFELSLGNEELPFSINFDDKTYVINFPKSSRMQI